jgi:hypothetical protein
MPIDKAADVDQVVQGHTVPVRLDLGTIGSYHGEGIWDTRQRANQVKGFIRGDCCLDLLSSIAQRGTLVGEVGQPLPRHIREAGVGMLPFSQGAAHRAYLMGQLAQFECHVSAQLEARASWAKVGSATADNRDVLTG